jgi:hypothetical protein
LKRQEKAWQKSQKRKIIIMASGVSMDGHCRKKKANFHPDIEKA